MKKRALLSLALVSSLIFSSCNDTTTFYSNVLRSDVYYQVYAISDVDILMVVDQSLTMQPRLTILKNQIQNFITTVTSRKAVDYHIAITTVDAFTQGCDLVTGAGGVRVITPALPDPVASAQSILDNVTSTPTDFWEQGHECAYQATVNHGVEFRRTGTPYMVLLFSDERDWSCQSNCTGVQPEDNPNWTPWPLQHYIDFFNALGDNESTVVGIYPVVLKNYTDCPGELSASSTVGDNQTALAESIAAHFNQSVTVGSICDSMLTDSFNDIAKDIADRGLVFQLSNQASGGGINVFVNGELIPFDGNAWTYDKDKNTITFTGDYAPPLNAVVEITYSQDVE